MKPIIVTSVILLAAITGEAMAACPGNSGSSASVADITGILAAGRYACGFQYDGNYFNETLSGGKVLDFRRGPASTVDPSETIATADGTFVITAGVGGGNPDTITYTYGASSFKYSITPKNTTATGTYTFCQEAGPNAGATLAVTVQVGPCAVQP
jgi:hypothetical protein